MPKLNPRVLVIDDNPEIHRDFSEILSEENALSEVDALELEVLGPQAVPHSFRAQLQFASQGKQALEMVRQALAVGRPYGMAFVDVRMPPGWDGVQTIAEIRKVDPNMKFVICTAYSDYTEEEAAEKLGLRDGLLFIVKPFDAKTVRQLAEGMSERPAERAAA
jgi:CheY-like chemotaxis protein